MADPSVQERSIPEPGKREVRVRILAQSSQPIKPVICTKDTMQESSPSRSEKRLLVTEQ